MTIIHKVTNSLASRLSLEKQGERDVLETVLGKISGAAYWRLREKGFAPGGIIDIGAHEGDWTRAIKDIFPAAPTLMIEAREEQEPFLQRVRAKFPDIEYVIALLGSAPRESVEFQINATGSSIYAERSDAPRTTRSIPMRTLDDCVSSYGQLEPPLFLKLDIQGGELDCLRGATTTLRNAEVLQLEVALLNYNEGAPLAAEVIAFMDAQGFAIFDIAGFVRPDGSNLVQIDVVFVAKHSQLRPSIFRFNS